MLTECNSFPVYTVNVGLHCENCAANFREIERWCTWDRTGGIRQFLQLYLLGNLPVYAITETI